MWKKGTIKMRSGRIIVDCDYWIKVYDEGSVFGINEGKISKLMIRIGSDTTCNYDRGWDIEPEDEITRKVYEMLLEKYN